MKKGGNDEAPSRRSVGDSFGFVVLLPASPSAFRFDAVWLSDRGAGVMDRQALAAALAAYDEELTDGWTPGGTWEIFATAARERLAQMAGMRLSVWWCTEHDASFQREAIPGPPTWDCWAGPIEDEHCVPILLEAFKAIK